MLSAFIILAGVIIIAFVVGGIVWAAREDYKDADTSKNSGQVNKK